METETAIALLTALSDTQLKVVLDTIASDQPRLATMLIEAGTRALCDYGEVRQERLVEANVCLSFSVMPADRGLRARQLRALLDCGIYKGAGVEADLQEELRKLLRDQDVQNYLANFPLAYPTE